MKEIKSNNFLNDSALIIILLTSLSYLLRYIYKSSYFKVASIPKEFFELKFIDGFNLFIILFVVIVLFIILYKIFSFVPSLFCLNNTKKQIVF